MISAIRGQIAAKLGDRVTLATESGVTYDIAVPLGVLERLPREGTVVELRTVLVVREDNMSLYGFDRESERELFQRLLAATGVGPRLALALLSALGGDRVVRAVKDRDLGALCTVPGVGKKTAERMVIELKDRLKELATEEPEGAASPPVEQAVQALMNLGYTAAESDRAVHTLISRDGTGETVDLIRRALQMLAKGK